jgi:hypothetical protein
MASEAKQRTKSCRNRNPTILKPQRRPNSVSSGHVSQKEILRRSLR